MDSNVVREWVDHTLVHEETYNGFSPASLVARRRLRRTLNVVKRLEIPSAGKLADFGCSNGYILSVLQREAFPRKDWSFFGFDHSARLLALARTKALPSTSFHHFDLNLLSDDWCESFDIVTCFETLEHTGNFRNAVRNLYETCKVGGRILISIPNENGIPGLLKFFGRKVVRRRPYGAFFERKSQLRYVWRLLTHQPIDVFREPPAEGWSPHLGFDSWKFAQYLQESLLASGKCRLVWSEASPGMFNHFYILERLE